MRILVSDRDRLSSQMMTAKLVENGHEVIEESVKNAALERVQGEALDAVFFDPAPLTNARPFILGLRRSLSTYAYIVMLSHADSLHDAVRSGVNDVLTKPLDTQALQKVLSRAQRLGALVNWMADTSQDYPNAGGVIAKSAFNQLFLSAMDRADRYGETSCLLKITVDNFSQILREDGAQAAHYLSSKLAHHLVLLRRQSDIIGQTGPSEYCLLLQRPVTEQEPVDAANRFAAAITDLPEIASTGDLDAQISVTLLTLPSGESSISHTITHAGTSMAAAAQG